MTPLPETLVVDRLADVLGSLCDRQGELVGYLRTLRQAQDPGTLGVAVAATVTPSTADASHPPAVAPSPAVEAPNTALPGPATGGPWSPPVGHVVRSTTRDYDYFSALEERIADLSEG